MTATTAPSSFGRKIRWLGMAMVALVLLVVAAWFAAAHFYQQAIDTGRVNLANEGMTFTCENERLGGFPARFELRCDGLTVSMANGASFSGGAFQTVAPAWNPLFTIAEWTGPFENISADGVDAQIASDLLRASVRLDSSFKLERLSAVLDPFSLTMQRAPQAIGRASQAELHIRKPEASGAGSSDLDVALLLLGVESLFLGSDQLDVSLSGTVGALAGVRARSLQEMLGQWVTQSGTVAPLAARLRIDDHAINLDGDVQLLPNGRVNFDGNIATNDVPALVQFFGVNDQSAAMAISAGAAFLGEQVTIGEETGTQLPLIVEQSQMRVGPVSLGQLPPIQF